jgi:acyl-CoA synthetase (AMP-forming)/AMP-acid ligase II
MDKLPAARNTPVNNIASHLLHSTARHPYRKAVVCPCGRDRYGRVAYTHLTFAQLNRDSDRLAHGLEHIGIQRGTRTVLMVRPGIEFFSLIFAMFKIGAVAVVVDPGMGLRRMTACLRSTRPEAFIGIPPAHVLRKLLPRDFTTVRTCVTVGRRWFWGGTRLDRIRRIAWKTYTPANSRAEDPAAILFTTGSTGPAKGAVYTHGNFIAQLEQIRRHVGFAANEVDLSTFPLFALFYPALGITAVVPDMDPTRPARVDPRRIVEAIDNQGVTNMFASPALLDRVAAYGRRHGIILPSLKRVFSAGAPVSANILEQFAGMLTGGAEIFTPYGATEAVPILSIGSREILEETRELTNQGFGICVGRPINDISIRIINISDEPIRRWSDDLIVRRGEIGEIAVKGALVSRHYFENPRADADAKIPDGEEVWHRMGDLGWEDQKGRIWFCGRKNHRVITSRGTLYTIPCEGILNTQPGVRRTALVGVGEKPRQHPVICVEPAGDASSAKRAALREELLALAARHPITQSIRKVLFHPAFPVDIRHNSKIFREKLALWAARQLTSKKYLSRR